MAYSSYYNRRKALGHEKTVVKYLGGGLNEVFSPINVGKNNIIDCINCYSPDGLSIATTPRTVPNHYFSGGLVFATWNGASSLIYPSTMQYSTGVWTINTLLGTSPTTYDITSQALIVDRTNMTCGALEYVTQAATYSIYWSTLCNFFVVQQQTTKAITKVTLPSGVYPKIIISHMTRLFLLDTNNTLWWSKGGDYTDWFGDTATDTYVAEDAGYWFIGSDDTMNNMLALGESIYIFGNHSIYRFDGWGDANFSLTKMFTGYGTYSYSNRSLAANKQHIFFTYNDKVYRFNGSSEPVLISEPVVHNEQITNGITGGIDTTKWYTDKTIKIRSLFVHGDNLYLFPRRISTTYQYASYVFAYVFDTKHGSWWRQFIAYRAPTGITAAGEMDVFMASEATEPSVAVTFYKNLSTWADNLNHASNIGYDQRETGDGWTKTYFDIPSGFRFFDTGAIETELEGNLRIAEVDLVWQYKGNYTIQALPPFMSQSLTFEMLAFKTGSKNMQSVLEMNATQTALNTAITTGDTTNAFYLEPVGGNTSHQFVVSYAVEQSKVKWQTPQRIRFLVNETGLAITQSPFIRFRVFHNVDSIEFLRMEIKYRAIGASR